MEERTIYQPSAVGSVRPGTLLNGIYQIEKFITQGGMGEVYRGFNIQTHNKVAIKMIRPELVNDPDVIELFKREASILETLAHDAVVRYFVFAVEVESARAYLAMEFVDGPSLTTRLASGPMPIADVRILQRRIASALEAAHQLGIIHRDISPDNIILPDGDVRRAKIIDFGIARSLRTGDKTIIGDGFAGKYNYVSPEQLGLSGGEVTFKSDIYSFGLVLAEALLGRPLNMNGTQAEIIEKRRAVPDLSGLDSSIRPLIHSMLQPLPANRPASMAAVAEWGEGAAAAGRGRGREPSPARASSGGRAAAILGALIVIVSLGGVGYVFRDDLSQWIRGPAGAPTAPPLTRPPSLASQPPPATTSRPATESALKTAALPPLAPAEAPTAPQTPSGAPGGQPQTATPPPAEAPSPPPGAAPAAPAPNPPAGHVPTSAELVDALPPRAPQPVVDLPPAAVGTPYRAELPGFTDHGGKGLRLAADSLPEGLIFSDLGDGKGAIEGAPTHAGAVAMHVIATNHSGRTAEMTATIVVADKAQPPASAPPPASSALAPPPPPSAATPPPQALPAVPANPEPPPQHEARLEPPSSSVAPAPAEKPSDPASLFAQRYQGGDCFLVKPLPGAGGAPAFLGVGDQLGPFQRFEEAFKKELGADPQLSVRLITPSECPALDLLRPGAGEAAQAPRIELSDYRVGRNKPLAGTVANLGGRHVSLILIDNAGAAYRLEAKPQPGGDLATFSMPLTPDASSIGPIQLVLAVASDKPIPALETFRSGPLKTLAPALVEEARSGSASVGAEFFTFVK